MCVHARQHTYTHADIYKMFHLYHARIILIYSYIYINTDVHPVYLYTHARDNRVRFRILSSYA